MPCLEAGSRLEIFRCPLFDYFVVWIACPSYLPNLAFSEEDNKVIAPYTQGDIKETRDLEEAWGVVQVGKVLANILGSQYRCKILHAEIL